MKSRIGKRVMFPVSTGAPHRSWLGDDADFPRRQSDVAVRPALCRPAKGTETEATMKRVATAVAAVLLTVNLSLAGQTPEKGKTAAKPAPLQRPAALSNEDMNLRAYMELLRTDVRKQKANIVGQVMQFDADEAAKFWPIYKEYDAELARLGDSKLALIKKYADNYETMTDAVADQLMRDAIQIDRQRHDLLVKYYGRMKDALGGISAARFLQVENQLLMLIDLQIASSLPVIR
jgi:hypothetical protein